MTATIVPPDTIEAEPARRTAQPIPTTRLVKVELRKMFNTRSGFWMLISIGVLSPISAGSLLVLGLNSDVTYQNFVRASGFPMSVILPIIAILAVTGEPAAGSSVINYVASTATTYSEAPSVDFFGTARKTNNHVDAGAVEFTGGVVVAAPTLTSIAPAAGARGAAVPVTLTGTNLTGTTAVTVSGTRITVSAITVVNPTTVTATFTIAGNAALGARTVSVTTPG